MAAVPPSKNTPKIIEEFIRYAQQHLGTITGLINTTSVFPSAPSPIILPSVVNWTGYFVTPATPSVALNSLQQSELTEVDEEELKQEIKTEEQLTRENLGEAKEILQSGTFSTELDEEVLTTHISNLEEKIENPEIIREGLRELKIQQKQTSIYGDEALTPDPTMTFNGNSSSDIQSIFNENEEPKQPIKKLPQSENLKLIEASLIKVGITDVAIIKAVKANALKESGAQPLVENMNYSKTSNERIKKIFTNRATKYTDAELNEIKKSAQSFGELMYGPDTKVGQTLGNTAVGDGYKYRGRGFIQLTGKGNYAAASLSLYKDDRLVKNPDLVATTAGAADTLGYFIKKNIPNMSKLTGIKAVGSNQADANQLITSVIAGDVVKRGGAGFLSSEALAKVDKFSLQV